MSYLARHGRQLWDHHELPTFMAQPHSSQTSFLVFAIFECKPIFSLCCSCPDPLSLAKQGAASNYPRRARGVLVLLASGRAWLRSYLEKLTNHQVDGIASGWRARRRESEAEPEISINLLFSSLLIRLACWSEDMDCQRQLKTFLAYRNYRLKQHVGFQRKSSL